MSDKISRSRGDVVQGLDVVCADSGGVGRFQFNASLLEPDGIKKVTVSQADVASGQTVSQLVVLRKIKAAVMGLRATITGTCDPRAASHSATSSVGVVRSVTCDGGSLTVPGRTAQALQESNFDA